MAAMAATNPAVTTQHRKLLDVNDLAERWGISTATIYRKRSLGEPLPTAVRIGSAVRWREEVVSAWEQAQEAK